MAYVSGTASSLSDLLTGICNACTANGWTLSGNVLHKGTCYAEVMISGSVITIRGGTGIDGSNALTGATDQQTGQLGIVVYSIAFGWPVTYEVFIGTAPDEVYVVTAYATNYYQQIAWGQSAMQGLAGTGNWYCGCRPKMDYRFEYNGFDLTGETSNGDSPLVSIFGRNDDGANFCHGVDHQLDGAGGWNDIEATQDMISLMLRQPNQWNGESILIPIRVYVSRPSGFISPVLECAHARFVNLANLNDGQILTLGSDKWKVYPFLHRTASQSYSGYASGSWYAGHAFHYDGP